MLNLLGVKRLDVLLYKRSNPRVEQTNKMAYGMIKKILTHSFIFSNAVMKLIETFV